MTLHEIKTAVDSGQAVYWTNVCYRVVKDRFGGYSIECVNGSTVGLTWLDGVTLNGKPEDFFTMES
jgi:hypothetical protein